MALQKNLTQEDIDANPILSKLQAVEGDVVSIYHPDQEVKLIPEISDPAPVDPVVDPVVDPAIDPSNTPSDAVSA